MVRGYLWTFDTSNNAPGQSMLGRIQYVWLNNTGDPNPLQSI